MATTADDIINQVNGLEELGDQVSFLQLGRMRYMVTPVGQDISISEELKAYVQTQVNGIKDQLSNVFETEIDLQMQKQLNHIQRMKQRGQVAIPSNLQRSMVQYIDNQVCQVKTFVFRPWCIKGAYTDIHSIIGGISTERFRDPELVAKFKRRRNRDGAFSLIFDSSIALPGAVALTKTDLRIVNELQTHHTYTGSGKLCIGGADPKRVFSLGTEALGQLLSTYNRFSPISSQITFGSTRYAWPQWLDKCSNFTISVDSPHGAATLDDTTPLNVETSTVDPRPAAEWRA